MTEPWIPTRSGVAFDLLAPRVEDVKIGDVAHALARINRFSGHTYDAYSVAQHSCLVADLVAKWGAPPDVQRQALLHDAPEAYYGDVTSPVAKALDLIVERSERGPLYCYPLHELRREIDLVVHEALGLPADLHPLVKRADLIAPAIERRDLMAPCERDWKLPEFAPNDVSILGTWSPYDAEPKFLAYLKLLDEAIARTAVVP